jgi:hypothetical protein
MDAQHPNFPLEDYLIGDHALQPVLSTFVCPCHLRPRIGLRDPLWSLRSFR